MSQAGGAGVGSALPKGFQLTELDAEFRAAPHPRLDRLRREQPVFWDPEFGQYFLTRYEDVRRVLMDRGFWRDPDKADPSARATHSLAPGTRSGRGSDARIGGIAQLDDPDHARIRTALAAALNRRMAAAQAVVDQVVRDWISRLPADRFDLMAAYAVPIPSDVIARLLGCGSGDLVQFRAWSEALIQIFHPERSARQTVAIARATRGFADYLAEAMNRRRCEPGDDLITDLLQLQRQGAAITDGEIARNCQTLLVAGNLTTADLIGNAVWLLLRHPPILARLRREPALIDAVVEETLRLESPVDITVRIAAEDLSIGGCPVARRQTLMLSLQAANRDPEVFERPEVFDPDRPRRPHVAFGGGAHICIGKPLARMEARCAILALLERFPTLRLAEPNAKPDWRDLPFFHGLATLPLEC